MIIFEPSDMTAVNNLLCNEAPGVSNNTEQNYTFTLICVVNETVQLVSQLQSEATCFCPIDAN